MFNYPATELFSKDGATRVVFSLEEYEAVIAEGFAEERPTVLDRQPVVLLPPTLEVVIAAGYGREVAEGIVANEQRKFAAGIQPYGDAEDAPAEKPEPPAEEKPEEKAVEEKPAPPVEEKPVSKKGSKG